MSELIQPTTLGRTGLKVGRLGVSSSYGMPASAVERAFEMGMNYFYWGSIRRKGFAVGLRNLARHREQFVLVLQSYSPVAGFLRSSVERGLRKLGFDYADVLLLGMWNRPVPRRILDAVHGLRESGLVRHMAVSTHKRRLVAEQAARKEFDIFHVRYNAVHRGAETDVFPRLSDRARPGVVSFTATCWGQLLKKGRIPEGERVPTAGDCYRFVLSNPGVDVCLTGLSSLEQTEHALDSLRRGPMSIEDLAWMRRVGAALYGGR